MKKGRLSISKPVGGSDGPFICITVNDKDAGIEFLRLDISLEDFADCLTGKGYVPCEFVARGLDKVGKVIERDCIKFPVPQCNITDRVDIAMRIAQDVLDNENAKLDDKWVLDGNFRQQNSFYREQGGGREMAQVSIVRWVNKPVPGGE